MPAQSLDHPTPDFKSVSNQALSLPAASNVPEPSLSKNVFGLMELELVHHYSTRTYMTLSSRLATHQVWRDTVFQEGLRHQFLLHGIMATSVLHKALSLPSSSEEYAECLKVALAYQDAGLAAYIPAVSTPNAKNAIALFSFSLLLTIWAFASRRLPESLKSVKREFTAGDTPPGVLFPAHSPTSEFITIITMLRGIYAVMNETGAWLQGEIEELTRYPSQGDLPPHSPEVNEAFDLLAEALKAYQPKGVPRDEEFERARQICEQHLETLRNVTRCRSVVEWDGHIFSWLIMSPPEFISLLKSGNDMALVLFAYWASFLNCMDHHWWANGWAYSLVVDVSNLLDSDWSSVLDWPRRQIGLVSQDGGIYDNRRS